MYEESNAEKSKDYPNKHRIKKQNEPRIIKFNNRQSRSNIATNSKRDWITEFPSSNNPIWNRTKLIPYNLYICPKLFSI